MINLLPPEEKEKFLIERRKKLITILWALVFFFLFCFLLISFSVKFYIKGQVEAQKIILQRLEKEFEQSGVQDLQKEINSINLTLTKLKEFYQKKTYLTEILERVSNTLPQETYLTNLSIVLLNNDEESGFKFSLSGFAPARGTLFELKKNLEKESDFKELYFPPTNWVKPIDIDFFVTFKIAQPNYGTE